MIDKQKVKLVNKCIGKIVEGDGEALELLFRETKNYFYVVARSYLDDKSKAEDVLSEAYYKVVVAAADFDRTKNGYNWIFEIVKNTALNQNKADKRRNGEPLEEGREPPYDIVDELIDAISLDEARATLSDEEKQIVYAYYYEGKTIKEIAAALKKPKSTVHYMLKNILAKLKDFLA